MHDLEGFFCKTVFSGIIDKFVQGKICPGPKQRLARPGEGKKRGALDLASPWALGRSVKRWELQKRGEAGWAAIWHGRRHAGPAGLVSIGEGSTHSDPRTADRKSVV